MSVFIQIITPARRGSLSGNRVTATRWAKLLRSLGHRVEIVTSLRGSPDVAIALHARRSHESIRRFRARYPERPLVLALTGTDLYRDIHRDSDAVESLRLASRLVLLQKEGLQELPAAVRHKARVILQSATPRRRKRKRKQPLRLAIVGHLRREKDPFRLLEALSRLPALSLDVVQAGRALEPKLAIAARRWMRHEHRYRWIGEVPAARARQIIADSEALVLSSTMEGGANVISEAVVCGVPVLASRIPSSVGLLGEQYEGYFEVGNSDSLAALVRRFVEDRRFRSRLQAQIRRRQSLFTPRAERQAWQRLLDELG
jgi:putative glycosyltransferase (TIGR04348 family)